ncbi:MAG: methyltransferase [Pseudomonadota bacterium]
MPLADLRNRLLRNPRFRAFAGRVWPFRYIARRQARRLFDISAGFVYSQVLMSCVRLGWFEALADGPRALDELASEGRLSDAAVRRLARAAHSLDLTEARGREHIALGSLGAAMVGDAGIAAMAAHHEVLYADLHDPLALLRGEKKAGLSDYWGYAGSESAERLQRESVAAYSRLMAASQPMIAEQVLDAYDFSGHRHLLDVGGGTGAFLDAVHGRFPHLQRSLFDLPGVLAAREAPPGALHLHPGSFVDDALPQGADLISLVRIIHDHDDDRVLTLLQRVREALAPGGTLLIAEPLAGTRGARAVGDAYFGFYLLAMGTGMARTVAEIDVLLAEAGFTPAKRHSTAIPLICSVLTAVAK